jgi:hypothetical protein
MLARLAKLPALRSLELGDIAGASEDVLVELGALRQLRRLRLDSMGETGIESDRNDGLTPRVAAALQALPRLRSLELSSTAVTAAAIEALPETLTHVGLVRVPHAGPDVYQALVRFPRLERLDLGSYLGVPLRRGGALVETTTLPPADLAEAQAAALLRSGARELRWVGVVPPAVRTALAGTRVERLTLQFAEVDDIAAVATLPHLRRLVIDGFSKPVRTTDLAPLRAAPRLAELHLRWTMDAPRAEVSALLPGVTVTTHGY